MNTDNHSGEDVTATRQVVVTLDAFEISMQALEHAARLAAHMGARLEGLFVEDIDLIHLTELPFLREVRTVSRSEASMDPVRIEQEFRVLARRAEQLLREQARRHNVTWSFRVWRGSIEADLMKAVADADVFALTRLGARLLGGPCARGSRVGIAVLFTGTEMSQRALDVAIKLASDPDTGISILLSPGDETGAARLRQLAEERIGDRLHDARFVLLGDGSVDALLDALQESGSAALIMERDHPLLQSTSLQHSLGRYNCPLIIVR